MNKERAIREAKDHLEYTHETLRRAFNNSAPGEKPFIDEVLTSIEIDVKQLEALEEMMKVWKKTKNAKSDELEIGE
jgi:hypothetical protein